MTNEQTKMEIIEATTDAIFLSHGIEYIRFTGTGIQIRQVEPDSGPLEKLKSNPVAANLLQMLKAYPL